MEAKAAAHTVLERVKMNMKLAKNDKQKFLDIKYTLSERDGVVYSNAEILMVLVEEYKL